MSIPITPSRDMSDSPPTGDREHALEVARHVLAGTDTIAVPDELVRDAVPVPTAPHEPEKALWIRVRTMNVAEKVKLAMRGNKDARVILIRDANNAIQRLVLQNPRITEDEILALARDRNTGDELLRTIADNRDWTKIYALRLALVENARTPAGKALHLLGTLNERDISRLAKSKQVPSTVATTARRMLFTALNRRG